MFERRGVRNSAGVLSEALSTVMDRPCDLGGVCSCVVGVENTLFGGVSAPTTAGLALSIDTRGAGGGNIEVGGNCRDFDTSAWGLLGSAGLPSPVTCGDI